MNTWQAWQDILLNGNAGVTSVGAGNVVLMMLLSFVLGMVIAYVYMWTHEGISYSRTFAASLVALPLLVAMMMMLMVGSFVMALGLFAVFGVIRFRNVLKDTRDTLFILWAILEGLAVGNWHYSTAVLALLGASAVFVFIRMASFGTRNRYDAVLTVRITGDTAVSGAALRKLLVRHAARRTLASERRTAGQGLDVTYRLLLRDPLRSEELRAELAGVEGFQNVSLYMHDDEAEI